MDRTGSRFLLGLSMAALAGSLPGGLATAQVVDDPRAGEIASRALEAVREGWALGRYDDARRVRISINLRGAGSQGLTANVVSERSTPRWRLDAAGAVGPLTLWALPDRTVLHVPSLGQYAIRAGGKPAGWAAETGRFESELYEMHMRLGDGYTALTLAGEETIDGAGTWKIEDRYEPGQVAAYWIDRRTHLPRRIVLDRPGRRDVRIDFAYGSGPRPIRAVASFQGARDVEVTLTPTYEASGRLSRLQIMARAAGGSPITTDVTFDWAPATSSDHFRFAAPAGASEVPFTQLAQGVMMMAAGALGGLVSIVMGIR